MSGHPDVHLWHWLRQNELIPENIVPVCGSAVLEDHGNGMVTLSYKLVVLTPRPPFSCLFCGLPSYVDPSDQRRPPDYCHEADHGSPEDLG